VREGGAASFTVRIAALLVVLPAESDTITLKVELLSPVLEAGVVKLAEAAPAMFAEFSCHW
jgi:hypothetical protein